MSFRDRIARSRQRLAESMNVLFRRGPSLDEDFWDNLEETLILSDVGARASADIVERLRDAATRKALPDAYAVLDALADEIAGMFAPADNDPFRINPVCVLFVGINGAGKTTTVGKIAYQASAAGRSVLIGSADTFRAAAIEQLDVWGKRSGVEVVKRERGADPASVCYDVAERAEQLQSDLVLIDTSGRLHTSDELMRELQKTLRVTRKRADTEVKCVLVIDATTGQNGLAQAREFNRALDLDGVIMTKLDGTAKGGIAVAVSHELGLPICRIGTGEGIEDLAPFDAHEYAQALFGDMRTANDPQDDATSQVADAVSVEGALEVRPYAQPATTKPPAESTPDEESTYIGKHSIPESHESSYVGKHSIPDGETSSQVVQIHGDFVPPSSGTKSPWICTTCEQSMPEAAPASSPAPEAVPASIPEPEPAPASSPAPEAAPEPAPIPEPETAPESEDEPAKKESFRERMKRWFS